MSRVAGSSTDLPQPAGPYSHGVRIGRVVQTAGQGPARSDGSLPSGIRDQTEQCLRNVLTALATVGAGPEDVLRVGVFLTTTDDFPGMNQVYGEVFAEPFPARTTVYVGLPEGLLVEIDALAVLPEDAG